MGAMTQLATGIRDISRGFGALQSRPGLWKWVLAPAVLTGLLTVSLIAGVLHLVDPANRWIADHVPAAIASIASGVFSVVVVVALCAAALLVFVPLAGMITGPFSETLSERIEAHLTGQPSPAFSWSGFVRGFLLGIGHGVRRLVVALLGLALVFAVGLVPVIGAIAAPLLAAWLTAQSAAYDCYDAVLARRTLSYRDKLDFLARHRGRTLGLGAGVGAMLLVPGLNLIALGVGAAGATVAAHAIDHGGAPGRSNELVARSGRR